MKYCEKCSTETVMTDFECKKCGGSIFVHNKVDVKSSRDAALGMAGASTPDSLKNVPRKSGQEARQTIVNPSTQTEGATLDQMKVLIAEQRRTTHAVRAIARYLLHQLTTVFAVSFGMSINLGNPDGPSDGATIFIGLVFIAGTMYSFALGWHELAQSD